VENRGNCWLFLELVICCRFVVKQAGFYMVLSVYEAI